MGIGLVDGRRVVSGWTFLSLDTTVQGVDPMPLSINDSAIMIVPNVCRIAGLEPIVETVCEFNMVKNPLEDWCTQQQEYFEHLPPLEVTEEQLREQAKEFEAVRADIAAHQEQCEKVEELAQRYLREMEVGVVICQSQCD